MKKMIKIFIFLAIITCLIIYKFFLYVDIKKDCFIWIEPSIFEFNNLNVKRAVKILKYALPEDYDDLCKNVKSIKTNFSCGGWGGGCYYADNPDSISITTSQRSLDWTAAIIVHEVCHVLQGNEGRLFSEEECYAESNKAIKTIIDL